MNVVRTCVLLAVSAAASAVVAQTLTPLPKTMSGRWTAVVPGRATFTDTLSIVLDDPGESGKVTGRLTLRGVTCGAKDEPLSGTWDGTELRFESAVRPNVNVQRADGQCESGRTTFVLARKPGQTSFQGESRRDGMTTTSQVTLSP